jgi:tight adherence protein C
MAQMLGLLAAAGVGLGVLVLFAGLTRFVGAPTLTENRLDQLVALPSLRERTLAMPFTERQVLPLLRRLTRLVASRSRANELRSLKGRLTSAGNPRGLGPADFLSLKALAATVSGVVAFALAALAGTTLVFLPRLLSGAALAALTALGGYVLPDLWLRDERRRRVKAIRRQLPRVLDIMAVCAEAGLDFQQALLYVTENRQFAGPLVDELAIVLSRVRTFGVARDKALLELSDKVGVDSVSEFVHTFAASIRQGVPVKDVLISQATEIRRVFKQRAAEQAKKAMLKMLFPLVFLILPAIFLLIMGPGVIRLLTGGQ